MHLIEYYLRNRQIVEEKRANFSSLIEIYLEQSRDFISRYQDGLLKKDNQALLMDLLARIKETCDTDIPHDQERLCKTLPSDENILLEVISVEQEAENENALLLWRASNGVDVRTANKVNVKTPHENIMLSGSIKLPDLSLRQLIIETPYQFDFKEYDYLAQEQFNYAPDLSFAYSFLAGIIYDGFKSAKSGCTYCFNSSSLYLYALKLNRKQSDDYLKLFLMPNNPPVELTVWGGGDYFHPRLYGLSIKGGITSNSLEMADRSELYQRIALINEMYSTSIRIIRGAPEGKVKAWYRAISKYFINASKYFKDLESLK